MEAAAVVLDEYVEKAVKALETLPPSRYTDYLEEIARFNTVRTQ